MYTSEKMSLSGAESRNRCKNRQKEMFPAVSDGLQIYVADGRTLYLIISILIHPSSSNHLPIMSLLSMLETT